MISVCCYGSAIYTSLFHWCVFTNPQSNHNYQKKSYRETCAVCIHLHPPLQLPPAVFSVYTRTDADSFLMKAGTIFAFLVYEKTFQEHLNSAEGLPGRCGAASEQQFKHLSVFVWICSRALWKGRKRWKQNLASLKDMPRQSPVPCIRAGFQRSCDAGAAKKA